MKGFLIFQECILNKKVSQYDGFSYAYHVFREA